jgi:hypothetical protein
MNIDKEIEAVEKLIDKYGSRKSLSAIIGMAAIMQIPIPDDLQWLKAAQIAGIAVLGCVAVVCQWNLDKRDTEGAG